MSSYLVPSAFFDEIHRDLLTIQNEARLSQNFASLPKQRLLNLKGRVENIIKAIDLQTLVLAGRVDTYNEESKDVSALCQRVFGKNNFSGNELTLLTQSTFAYIQTERAIAEKSNLTAAKINQLKTQLAGPMLQAIEAAIPVAIPARFKYKRFCNGATLAVLATAVIFTGIASRFA